MRTGTTSLDLLRRWAVLLDSYFRVPGTRIRFGLDAIIGLVPGLGDFSAPVFAAVLIATGFRMRVPAIVQFRMVLNAGLDMVLVVKDFDHGEDELWSAVRPALVALDPTYKGDDKAFCAAYGSGMYAPALSP